MPIYEYQCGDCGERFEYLVRGEDKPECPACGGRKLDKQISAASTHIATARGPGCPARDFGACGESRCPPGGCGGFG
jgi:putative FmdB family regulatory protein